MLGSDVKGFRNLCPLWTGDVRAIWMEYLSQTLQMSLLAVLKARHLEGKYLLHFTE